MTTQIDPRITKARTVLVQDHPFYGTLAMRLALVEDSSCPRMATDGDSIFYNPKFLDEMPPPHLRFVLAHEVSHCTLGHHARRGTRDPLRYNKATDYVINIMLTDAGFERPDWVLYDERFRGFNSDQVYRILEEEEKKQKQDEQKPEPDQPQPSGTGQDKSSDDAGNDQPDDSDDADSDEKGEEKGQDGSEAQDGDQQDGGQPGDKPGEGGSDPSGSGREYHGDYPGSCGEVLDAAPAHEQAALDEAAEEWATHTRQAVNIARRIGEGKLPGDIEQIINDLERTRTDWRDALQRFIDPSASKDYTWSKPSVRMMGAGFITPGMVSDGINHVAMLIDTSGSIDQDWLKTFGGEVQTALDSGMIDRITLVFGDTDVRRTAEYSKGDIIDFTCAGRGGTRFAPLIEWVTDNAPDVAAAIYFTDLDCSEYGEQPAFPIMWAAYGSPMQLRYSIPRVPFGEVVELAN